MLTSIIGWGIVVLLGAAIIIVAAGMGAGWMANTAIRRGKLDWSGKLYRVELASQTQDVVADEINDAVLKAMRGGKYDQEIFRANRRNSDRQGEK